MGVHCNNIVAPCPWPGTIHEVPERTVQNHQAMSAGDSFKGLKDTVTSALVETTKTATKIANGDLAFHQSTNPAIVPLLELQRARLLTLANGLITSVTQGTEVSATHLADVESVDDSWKSVVDVIDNLLEKADASLDEITGSIRKLSPGQEEKIKRAAPSHGKHRNTKIYHHRDMQKPQLFFNAKPNNDGKTPFKPLLQSKPHAIIPLEDSLRPMVSNLGHEQYVVRFHSST